MFARRCKRLQKSAPLGNYSDPPLGSTCKDHAVYMQLASDTIQLPAYGCKKCAVHDTLSGSPTMSDVADRLDESTRSQRCEFFAADPGSPHERAQLSPSCVTIGGGSSIDANCVIPTSVRRKLAKSSSFAEVNSASGCDRVQSWLPAGAGASSSSVILDDGRAGGGRGRAGRK